MPPKKAAKKSAGAKALTKAQVAGALADATELSKRQIVDLFEKVVEFIGAELRAGRPVNLMGLIGIKLINKAAVAAGMRNVAGSMRMCAAKPASKKVRVVAKKLLKDLA